MNDATNRTPWTRPVLANCAYLLNGYRAGRLRGPEAERQAKEAEAMLAEARADGVDLTEYAPR